MQLLFCAVSSTAKPMQNGCVLFLFLLLVLSSKPSRVQSVQLFLYSGQILVFDRLERSRLPLTNNCEGREWGAWSVVDLHYWGTLTFMIGCCFFTGGILLEEVRRCNYNRQFWSPTKPPKLTKEELIYKPQFAFPFSFFQVNVEKRAKFSKFWGMWGGGPELVVELARKKTST